jgi:hypothetical protein
MAPGDSAITKVRKREESMAVQKMTVDAVGPDEKWMYRAGGLSALADFPFVPIPLSLYLAL